MSLKKKQEQNEEKDWNRVEDAVFESSNFLFKYQKQILIVVGACVVIACGILAYKTFYLKPKTQEAQVAIFKGEQYFQNGQDSLAIFGDGNGYIGFEAIINDYSSTSVANLAKYRAGVSYYRLGKYDQAISHLKSYSGNDEMIAYTAKGLLGDCYVNTGKIEDGAKAFVDAANGANNDMLSPLYLKKAAIVYRDLKNHDKVIELFTKIKNNYMNSADAVDADKYIEEAKVLKGSK